MMTLERFPGHINSADDLAKLIGPPSELVIRKQLTCLDEHMQTFINESPFFLLGTAGADGKCDVSPRGDPPPVARVVDSETLVIPERNGNRRSDSLRNIIETGRVGLLFLIPGQGETLRINGRACVFQDGALLASMSVRGRQPVVGIGVEPEECYFQCAKALIRSRLWESSSQHRDSSLPCYAQILIDQTKIEGETVESLNQRIEESYAERLY